MSTYLIVGGAGNSNQSIGQYNYIIVIRVLCMYVYISIKP